MTIYLDTDRRCVSAACFCAHPPLRRITSLGVQYTVEELPPAADGARLFRYLYLPEEPAR